MSGDGNPADLAKVHELLARLDELVRDHPELVANGVGDVDAWVKTLANYEETGAEGMPTTQIGVRLPNELLDKLDAYAKQLTKDNPGMKFTRADAERILLTRGLEGFDPKPRKKP